MRKKPNLGPILFRVSRHLSYGVSRRITVIALGEESFPETNQLQIRSPGQICWTEAHQKTITLCR